MAYKRLLVAIDLGATSDQIATKAATMARNQQAEIHVLHIVEPLSLTYGADLHLDTRTAREINEQADSHLARLARISISPNNIAISEAGGLSTKYPH